MVWAVVSLVPVGVALAIALGLFAAWAAWMIRSDRALEQRLASTASPAAVPTAPEPLAVVTPISAPITVRVEVPVVTRLSTTPVPVPVAVDAPDGEHEEMWAELAQAEPEPEPESEPEPEAPVVVRSGSFCTVVGATGVTAAGTEMVCTAIEGARPRWRRATRELAHTS